MSSLNAYEEHAVVDRSARLPTEAEIAEINARHLIETPLQPADLLFVFGTREDVGERVDEACRLWNKGYFRWSIVSGGITPGSNRSEGPIGSGVKQMGARNAGNPHVACDVEGAGDVAWSR